VKVKVKAKLKVISRSSCCRSEAVGVKLD